MIGKKSQGLSINVIIIVAIALIVLVVLIAIFTGRLGSFVRGVDETVTCETSCEAFGMDFYADKTEVTCKREANARYVPGTYMDIPTTGSKVCCCKPRP